MESCRMVLPQGAIVAHQTQRLAARGDFREGIAVISDASEQAEQFVPRIRFLPLGKSRRSVLRLRFIRRAAPRRNGSPQLINVTAPQPFLEQVEAGTDGAVGDV